MARVLLGLVLGLPLAIILCGLGLARRLARCPGTDLYCCLPRLGGFDGHRPAQCFRTACNCRLR